MGTSLLTDVVLGPVAVQIVPEVVPVEVERIPVPLHQSHAVLPVPVVRLSLSPVKPLDSLVPVRPDPLPWAVLVVTLSSEGSHPELNSVSGIEPVEELGLEPVVDPGVVQLSDPGIMELAEKISIVSGDSLCSFKIETSTAGPVLLQDPAVRAVVSVLSKD